jgi:hypothetical protein
MNARKPPPSVKQLCEGVDPNSDVEHIIVCPVCGQMFDCRDSSSVAHHSAQKHVPKLY